MVGRMGGGNYAGAHRPGDGEGGEEHRRTPQEAGRRAGVRITQWPPSAKPKTPASVPTATSRRPNCGSTSRETDDDSEARLLLLATAPLTWTVGGKTLVQKQRSLDPAGGGHLERLGHLRPPQDGEGNRREQLPVRDRRRLFAHHAGHRTVEIPGHGPGRQGCDRHHGRRPGPGRGY